MLNKQKGNMYGFITHTWNPIKGKCSHDCKYCYMKIWKQNPLRLAENELKDDLGKGNFIFVGSSTDMFAEDVSGLWISEILEYCRKFDNKYLFQSKNPERFFGFSFPENIILGTTIETNRYYGVGEAPNRFQRMIWVHNIPKHIRRMISIEPIMDFDLKEFVGMIQLIKPEFISIGADSKGHNLPEPSSEKIKALIKELKKLTKVILKPNLKRLLVTKEDNENRLY